MCTGAAIKRKAKMSACPCADLPRATADALGMPSMREVRIDQNPWTSPPEAVVRQGLDAVHKYFDDLKYGGAISNSLKLVLVGLPGAGKTSIAIRLCGLDHSKNPPRWQEPTVGVEIRNFSLPARQTQYEEDLAVSIWDFAGQSEYYVSHQVNSTQLSGL